MTPETSEAIERMREIVRTAALIGHRSVTLRREDIALLLADMPCASCVIVETCKGQADQLRRQWDEIARLRGHD